MIIFTYLITINDQINSFSFYLIYRQCDPPDVISHMHLPRLPLCNISLRYLTYNTIRIMSKCQRKKIHRGSLLQGSSHRPGYCSLQMTGEDEYIFNILKIIRYHFDCSPRFVIEVMISHIC